ncbi:MAG: 50S ribosomal protein L6 [Desulfurococcales archaeon]|nr:50S ribosomal protein L6 [Desulfurococcales archaeon]
MGGTTARFVVAEERVEIPRGVEIQIEGKRVIVRGPKGEVVRDFSHAKRIMISREDGYVVVRSYMGKSREKSLVYTVASHIRNMFTGVTKGYRCYLKIIFTHFSMSVNVEKDRLLITRYLGGQDVKIARILPGVKVTVKDRDIIVEGADLEAVMQTAANIERATRVRDKDRRIFVDGIYIYKKEVVGE